MHPADIVVIALGPVLVGWELWYFLIPPKHRVLQTAGGLQEITIIVKDGYQPATIPVEVGKPVRLNFYRDETASCSERVVFESLGIEQSLPAYETTTVAFTPKEPGDYPFRCGNSVLRGRVVAAVGSEAARRNLGRGHTKHG